MPRTTEDGEEPAVRLLPARYVPMTPKQRATAVAAMAALLAHARRAVLEGDRGDDVCLTSTPTSTREGPPR